MKKIIKLSVAAALAATAMNASVVENVKLAGNAKLFYETNDAKISNDVPRTMFLEENPNTKGQVIINVKASASVGPITANYRHATLTTMGLENTVVQLPQVTTTNTTDTINYVDIANLSATIGGTTVISGKQELNTPLCFTEKWNVTSNTFDANVLVNKSLIPNTTLIYADVQTSNAKGASITDGGAALNASGSFERSINANMVAASTNIAGASLNAYYYDVNLPDMVKTFSATWVDASYTVAGVKVDALYSELDMQADIFDNGKKNTYAQAVSVGTKVAGISLFGAYSNVSDGHVSFQNVATNKKTKLPTQAVYVDGSIVAQPGAETVKVKAAAPAIAGVKLALQYVNSTAQSKHSEETDLIVKTKIAGVDLKALVMNIQKANKKQQTNFRVYANYSF
jgi:hypothetical protein